MFLLDQFQRIEFTEEELLLLGLEQLFVTNQLYLM